MRRYDKDVIYGIYSDEELLLSAVRNAKSKHLEIMDVFHHFQFTEWIKHWV